MERIFYVNCPKCDARWPADWSLRHSEMKLCCYKCRHEFRADEAKELDEREKP